MTDETKARERLADFCLALPAATRQDQGSHSSFLVAKKVFAYYLNDHHGDGIIGVCCKVLPYENQRLLESDPHRFYKPAYLWTRGWVGLRLDLQSVDWAEVNEIVKGSYLQIAPKRSRELLKIEGAS
jgi:predicted DNA-binding protein (MmcQ/YjbR family)